ncbi:MAG: hypothetical protein NC911_02950 [Candidatus Omnitrophica bacterium]|nr:hypothetical protein [Candidatus Omnitrophota bacterium]
MVKSIFRSWKSKIFDDEVMHAPEVYSEKELTRIKNAGHTGIWVAGLLRDLSHSDVFPEFNRKENQRRIEALKILVQRAFNCGLEVFVYLVEPRNLSITDFFWKKHPEIKGTRGNAAIREYQEGYAMCTSDRRVLEFLENSTRNLFKLVPGLKGMILVTASEHLHHCLSFATPSWPNLYEKQYPHLCPKCRDRDAVGLIAEIINHIAQGAFSANSDAEIIASAWGWTWYETPPHPRLIEAIDKRIAIETFFEKGGVKRQRNGQNIRINEYALSYIGPSPYVRRLIAYLKKKRRKFYLKLVLGTTHELVTIPCLPVATQVYQKVTRAKKLKPYGFMSFTFGTIPCINLRVFEKILPRKILPRNQKTFLQSVAKEYYPGCDPKKLYQAWKHFSSALNLYPFSNSLMYYGPVCFALAYRQFPGPVKGKPMSPTWLPFASNGDDLSSVCTDFSEKIIIKRFEEMSRLWQQGLVWYHQGMENVLPRKKRNEIATVEIIPLIFQSVANVFKIHLLKKSWHKQEMEGFRKIIRQELFLGQKALPLLRMNKLLGYHVEAGTHLFSERLVNQKIRHLRRLLR